jgi:signal transduction histidine kinase/ActR/RegA family two-component response regulator
MWAGKRRSRQRLAETDGPDPGRNPKSALGGRSDGSTLWPVVVFVTLLVFSLIGFAATRRVIDDQEQRLLQERAAEVASSLSSSIGGIEASMRVLAAGLSQDPAALEVFPSSAKALQANGAVTVGGLLEEGGSFRVLAAVGEALRRALDEQDTAAGLFEEGDGTHLMVAVPAPTGVVFQETIIQPQALVPSTPRSPFGDLRVALYAAPEPDTSQLVLSTESELPMSGDVLRVPFPVGAEDWSLSVAANDPLVDSLARQTPWLILAGGTVAAMLAAAVTLTLARRRAYALNLVGVRTADLATARELAEHANRSKSEFLSRMSHELRTPLNAVLGFGQLLEMSELTAEQRDNVAHIRKGGQHLLQLINEVLDISRVETGNIALSPEAVRVGDLITESRDLIGPLAEQRAIQVVANRDHRWDTYVLADRQRSKQVLLNILSNAVKYNRQRGTVAVSCDVADGGRVRISVTDTGPGIRADQLDLLFMPFERLGAENSDTEGTGIGLALSQRLAEAMGGTLTAESTPGRGSTFVLELPPAEGPVERYTRLNGDQEPVAAPDAGPVERTILHIEDNLSNLTLVERILASRPGVKVVAAMQGRLGVELAHEHRPVLVLLDLHLPDMSGEDVLQRLRDDPITASTPVVIVSADATPGQVQRLVAFGAAGYLTKPIEVRELLRHVDNALDES